MKKDIHVYLNTNSTEKRLIIGCGTTPERVMMGTMPGMPCYFGCSHETDFTIDISPDAGADMEIDLVTFRGTALGIYGKGKFDTIIFEQPNRGTKKVELADGRSRLRPNPFSSGHINLWIEAADFLLKPAGKIIFYSGGQDYLCAAESRMLALGYQVNNTRFIPPSGDVHRGVSGRQGIKPSGWWPF